MIIYGFLIFLWYNLCIRRILKNYILERLFIMKKEKIIVDGKEVSVPEPATDEEMNDLFLIEDLEKTIELEINNE